MECRSRRRKNQEIKGTLPDSLPQKCTVRCMRVACATALLVRVCLVVGRTGYEMAATTHEGRVYCLCDVYRVGVCD